MNCMVSDEDEIKCPSDLAQQQGTTTTNATTIHHAMNPSVINLVEDRARWQEMLDVDQHSSLTEAIMREVWEKSNPD